MKNNFENLILLEFMVNKVEFFERESKIDKNFLYRLGCTNIQIKFKGCVLEILEDENSRREICETTGACIVYLDNGKSCLFSMAQLMKCGDTRASVCFTKKAPEGERKEYFTLGQTEVDIEPLFKALLASCGGATKSMKGTYDLTDTQCCKIGAIDLFMRATDLGKNIVTMFHLGSGESSFYFKGTDPSPQIPAEESSCFVCSDMRAETTMDERFFPPQPAFLGQPAFAPPPCMGGAPPAFAPQPLPYREGVTYSQAVPQMRGGFDARQMSQPRGGPMGAMGPGYTGPSSQMPPYGQGDMSQAQQQYPPYQDSDYEKLEGEYKEISAEVNGYEVKIKLLRRPKKNKNGEE